MPTIQKSNINWQRLINSFLEEKKISQFKFAILLKCSLPSVSRWCRGLNKPDHDMQDKILEIIEKR